jgi:SNF2 family DNA or RNA helicase
MEHDVRNWECFGLSWKGQLFPYQQEGIERLSRESCVLLADEMGLGKTIQAVAALRILHQSGGINGVLVVAPAGLVMQWRRQFREWAPELRLSTVIGSSNDRRRAWMAEANVYLVGYDTLRSDVWLKHPSSPGVREWTVVVLDEAQRIKNVASETTRAVKRLRRGRSWGLTGTPLENHLDDLVSILDFVAPGRFSPAAKAVGLRRLLGEVQIRRLRKNVLQDLPPKFASTVTLALTPRQVAAYRRAEEEGLIRLSALGRDVRITHVLGLILRLKQICNFCPETGESTKLTDLRVRLDSIVAGGEKALVFSQYADGRFGARRIARELAAFSPVLFTGDLDPQIRTARLAEFANDPRRHVLVLSLRAGGVGLNLTDASHVIHFDRWWNPAVESQAEDRAHRIGQERPVHVHSYLCGDSVEERVEEILQEKRMLFADVIDGVDTRMLGRLDLDTLLAAVRGGVSPR